MKVCQAVVPPSVVLYPCYPSITLYNLHIAEKQLLLDCIKFK